MQPPTLHSDPEVKGQTAGLDTPEAALSSSGVAVDGHRAEAFTPATSAVVQQILFIPNSSSESFRLNCKNWIWSISIAA